MKKILLVDDDPILTAIYRNLLRGYHYDVTVAINGEQGFQMAMRHKPDLVLLDLDMPISSGLQCLRRIRKLPVFNHMPIIVLTGTSIGRRVLSATEAGATLVLYKGRDRPYRVLEAIRQTAVLKGTVP